MGCLGGFSDSGPEASEWKSKKPGQNDAERGGGSSKNDNTNLSNIVNKVG